jgi:hypothetical protein
MEQHTLTQDVVNFGDGLRRSRHFENLTDDIRTRTDATFNEATAVAARLDAQAQAIAARTAVEQQAAAVRVTATRRELFAAVERAAADLDRVKARHAADRAAHEARRDGITSGRLVADGKGGHA